MVREASPAVGHVLGHSWTALGGRPIAELLERTHPDLVVSNMKKELRKGKVLVDWSQNNQHKTTVCVYSLRAMSHPTGSTPVTWDEVEAGKLDYDQAAVVKRVEKHGDLFAPVLTLVQSIPG